MKVRNLKWRKTLLLLLGGFGVASLQADIDDAVLRFSTPGVDHYADMRMVADGECYALVWSPAGRSFAGFNADGTPADPRDRVILAAPLAKGGRCPETIFQVPASTFAALSGGEWSVCLIDTRDARGIPVGVSAGRPLRVNRWGAVPGGVAFETANATATKFVASAASRQRSSSSRGTMAGIVSEVPSYAERPTITSFEVADGTASLEVDGTVPYLTYTVLSGETLKAMAKDASADQVDGGGTIELKTRAPDGSGFFKVIRAE